MLIDEARVYVESGAGGNGAVHFRREKYVPRGGPDGGDGGDGGSVVLQVSPTLNTLIAFRRKQHFRAQSGGHGGGSNKTGKTGEDLIIPVPPGTVVYEDASGRLLGDLVEAQQELVVAAGGEGGRGNARFANSRNQAPRMAEKGAPGVERWLRLELKLIADVGIIGLPNAGKSTLLSVVTNAKPKIAAYPFTTLHPNLGVADVDGEVSMVLADIPGLIEGAHEGAGLGHAFLRHIQRTKALIHLIAGDSLDPLADYAQVNAELALFDERLSDRPQIVAVNKIDIPDVRKSQDILKEFFDAEGVEVMFISALAREGLRELLYAAWGALQAYEPEEDETGSLPLYQAEPDPMEFTITREEDGAFRIHGAGVERAAKRTYWQYEEPVRRFQKLLLAIGVEDALRNVGAEMGDTVRVAEYEFEWVE